MDDLHVCIQQHAERHVVRQETGVIFEMLTHVITYDASKKQQPFSVERPLCAERLPLNFLFLFVSVVPLGMEFAGIFTSICLVCIRGEPSIAKKKRNWTRYSRMDEASVERQREHPSIYSAVESCQNIVPGVIILIMQRLRVSWFFCASLLLRLCGAALNIVHDCDEVYNYWEPLHRLLYGFGKEPWEYSPQYALRSYLYIILHWIFAAPLSWIFGSAVYKVLVFYGVRCVFAVISAILEMQLYRCRPRSLDIEV